jgi:peptidoglycan-associated lipoprotein
VFRRTFAVLLLSGLVVACASTGPTESAGESEFQTETPATDPGLAARSGMTGAAEASSRGLETVYFDFDAYALRAEARATLEANAQYLRDHPGMRIEVQGNCDERGSTEYNLALGQKRAEAAKRYLVDLGIDTSRIDTISFGEENPAVRGHSETAWAKNRRDDFINR